MSKEKQIEKIAQDICGWCNVSGVCILDGKKCDLKCRHRDIAETIYTAGYRKQEWISVEERLPKVDTDVLVITANGSFKVGRCNIYHNGTLVLWMTNDGLGEKAITHWMPLPEAPKMKGVKELNNG